MSENLFIDTSVFVKHNYLNGIIIKSLLELSRDEMIKIFLTDFSFREILSNIKSELNIAQGFIKKKEFGTLRHFEHINSIFDVNPEDLFKSFEKDFRKYIDHYKITVIPNSYADIEFITDSYFNANPPFSEKKRNEFPDAIIISTLMEYFQEIGEDCMMLCLDNDFSGLPCDHLKSFDMSQISSFVEEKEKQRSAQIHDKIESARYLLSENIEILEKAIIDYLYDVQIDYEPFTIVSQFTPLFHDFIGYRFKIDHYEIFNGNYPEGKIYFNVQTSGPFVIDFHYNKSKLSIENTHLITETREIDDVSLSFQGTISVNKDDYSILEKIEILTVEYSDKLYIDGFYFDD